MALAAAYANLAMVVVGNDFRDARSQCAGGVPGQRRFRTACPSGASISARALLFAVLGRDFPGQAVPPLDLKLTPTQARA